MSTLEVPCTIDIEHTAESLHAYASIPDDVLIQPGDTVTIHGAPGFVPFGERLTVQCSATVVHAGWLGRFLAYLMAPLEITELYEVGFLPKEST